MDPGLRLDGGTRPEACSLCWYAGTFSLGLTIPPSLLLRADQVIE